MIDFFEQQQRAKKRTRTLVVVYIVTVLIAAAAAVPFVAVIVAIAGGLAKSNKKDHSAEEITTALSDLPTWLFKTSTGWTTILIATSVIAGLIFAASFYKLIQLSAGGRVIAEMLGGRLIPPNSRDPHERRLLNIVEEMALASGTPIPPVYVMDGQTSINAFAAGFAPADAVVGVTDGTLRRLNRDQLQGVVAHEFSHILNGDMRLNLRLIAMLHGLLAVALLGRVLFEVGIRSGSRSSGSKKDGGGAPIFIAGLGLMVIGFLGSLAGRLIQSAISRQREYLADASAVQFTRDPSGIASALRAIGGTHQARFTGERVGAVAECRHMFFSSALTGALDAAFATHPPLPERIRRLDPNWDGTFLTLPDLDADAHVQAASPRAERERADRDFIRDILIGGAAVGGVGVGGRLGGAAHPSMLSGIAADAEPVGPMALAASVVLKRIEANRAMLADLPPDIAAAIHEPYEARLVILAALLADDEGAHEPEWNALSKVLSSHELATANKLTASLRSMGDRGRQARLSIVMVSLGTLSALSLDQYANFKQHVDAVVNADGTVDLGEWMLQQLIDHDMAARLHAQAHPPIRVTAIRQVARECTLLLSMIALSSNGDPSIAQRSFASGVGSLGMPDLSMLTGPQISKPEFTHAIDTLTRCPAPVRARIVRACATAAGVDGVLTPKEADMLQFLSHLMQTG